MQVNAAVATRRPQVEQPFKPLFLPYRLGEIEISNRLVMAPMTRSRALEHNVPNPIAATYYAQRASAGLIITEATQVSPQGVGYIRTPGIHSAADGAKRVSPLLRRKFDRSYIVNGGFDLDTANAAIRNGEADLVAFGVPFLANPDLPERYRIDAPLNVPDQATFYAGEHKGFTDYPALA